MGDLDTSFRRRRAKLAQAGHVAGRIAARAEAEVSGADQAIAALRLQEVESAALVNDARDTANDVGDLDFGFAGQERLLI